jgi:hypothetical protein
MSDGALAASTNEAVDPGRTRAFDTILYGELVVGVLNILDAGPPRVTASIFDRLYSRNSLLPGEQQSTLAHPACGHSGTSVCGSLFCDDLYRGAKLSSRAAVGQSC